MNSRAGISFVASSLLLLASSLCASLKASSPKSNSEARPLGRAPARSKTRPKPIVYPPPAWPPPDVDASVPPVNTSRTCLLPQVLSGAGRRIQQLAHNLDRFTATETVQHHKVDHAGHLHEPKMSRFNYLVSFAQRPSGYMNVEEYRNGETTQDEFPDHVATEGTPSLVLIFHPKYVKSFSMSCEGLGEWHGKPAWQVRFHELNDRRAMISIFMDGHVYDVKIRGRAWILADSYQVARLETDLVRTIPEIRLRLDHQTVEYGPVRFPRSKVQIWLPSSTELFMDFHGHRFYRRHTFSDFNLFSVKVDQQIGDPAGYGPE